MTDKPDVPAPIVDAQRRLALSDSASSHAPFLYFEEASAFGHVNGVIRITLEAARLIPNSNGGLIIDTAIVAHLRMNIPAALALKSAIDGALLLAQPTPSESKN